MICDKFKSLYNHITVILKFWHDFKLHSGVDRIRCFTD